MGDVSCLKVVGKSKMVVGKSEARALPERALPEGALQGCKSSFARINYAYLRKAIIFHIGIEYVLTGK